MTATALDFILRTHSHSDKSRSWRIGWQLGLYTGGMETTLSTRNTLWSTKHIKCSIVTENQRLHSESVYDVAYIWHTDRKDPIDLMQTKIWKQFFTFIREYIRQITVYRAEMSTSYSRLWHNLCVLPTMEQWDLWKKYSHISYMVYKSHCQRISVWLKSDIIQALRRSIGR